MGKSTTEQAQESKNTQALKKIGMEQLFEFLNEDDGDYTRERKLLNAVYKDALSDSKTAMYSANSLLDRDLGKAKESKDVTSGGKPLQTVSFDIIGDDTTTGD